LKKELRDFGLTENEAKVYLALLEIGSSTVAPIKHKSDLHTSRIYEALSSLIKKGLVSYFMKNNVKHFNAEDPKVMYDILDDKKEQLINAMPEFQMLQNKEDSGYSVSVYEGYKSVKQIFDHTLFGLNPKDEVLVIGAQAESEHFLNRTYFKEYNARRIKKKVKMRILFNHNALDTAKEYAKMPFTKVGIQPKNSITPTAMNIYPDRVSILMTDDKPVVFQIVCENVAKSYQTYFEFLWKGSKTI